MGVYMISFDLDSPGQNYDAVNNAIKNQGNWAKILTTTYIVVSKNTSSQIVNNVKVSMDSNDKLFVAKLSGETAWTGPFSKEASEWLKKNIVSTNL